MSSSPSPHPQCISSSFPVTSPSLGSFGARHSFGPRVFVQGGGGSSFRSLIHYSSNLGQTGSCNLSEASLFHCSRKPDRPPHNPGRGRGGGGVGGGGSPLESGQQAAAHGDLISVHTPPGTPFCLIIACKPWATGFLCYFLLQGLRGGQNLWKKAGSILVFFFFWMQTRFS